MRRCFVIEVSLKNIQYQGLDVIASYANSTMRKYKSEDVKHVQLNIG